MKSQLKPNFTAWLVMQGIIAAMNHPDYKDAANDKTLALYKPLSYAASKTRLVARFIYSLPYKWQYRVGQWTTSPGRLRHFYFRKKEVENHVRAQLRDGITQVVVLGAGLDVLSLRLAQEFPAAHFIEIDTRESQDFKTGSLKAHHVPLPANVEFLEGDLRDPLADILAKSTLHKSAAKTVWIAEGFLMFIPEESVVRILKEVKQLSIEGSPLIFTTLPALKQSSFIAHLMQIVVLRMEKSTFQWVIPFDKLPVFMRNLGYSMISHTEYDALQKSHMRQKLDINHGIGENIHIAMT